MLRSIEAWSAESGAPTSPLACRMLSAGRRPDSIASTTARPRSAGPCVRGDAEQAREQRRERAARLHLAEIEDLHAMAGDAARTRGIR